MTRPAGPGPGEARPSRLRSLSLAARSACAAGAAVYLLLSWMLLAQTAHVGFMAGELALSWTLHAGLFALFCQPVLHRLRRRRLQLAALLATVLAWWPWIPVWLEPRLPRLERSPDLVLLGANTFHHNPKVEAVAETIEASGADLVALIEPDLRLFEMLPSYRVVAAHESSDKYGIALLIRPSSALEVLDATVVHHASIPAPMLEARLSHHGRTLRVFALHVLAPTDPKQQRQRPLQVEELMQRVGTSTVPAIVFGDLNMVMASPIWRRVRAGDRLRRPQGWTPATWPWQLGPFGIAIDHVLLSPSLAASAAEPIHLHGSDHRGVRVSMAWRPSKPEWSSL